MRTERKEELYPPPSSFGATGVTESQRRRGERRSFPSLRSLRIEEGGRARGKRKEGRKGSFFASVSGGENSVARKKREKETKALHCSMEAKRERIRIWLFILLSSNSTYMHCIYRYMKQGMHSFFTLFFLTHYKLFHHDGFWSIMYHIL